MGTSAEKKLLDKAVEIYLKPTPRPGENRGMFLDRCVPDVISRGETDNPSQAAAICHGIFDNKNKDKDMENKDPKNDGKKEPDYTPVEDAISGKAQHTAPMRSDGTCPPGFRKVDGRCVR